MERAFCISIAMPLVMLRGDNEANNKIYALVLELLLLKSIFFISLTEGILPNNPGTSVPFKI